MQEEQAVGATYCKKIDSLLQQADFVMLVVSLTPQTHKLIGKRELELMKPTATLINISRGTIQIHWLASQRGPAVSHSSVLHPAQLGHLERVIRKFLPLPLPFSLCSLLFACQVQSGTLSFHPRCCS